VGERYRLSTSNAGKAIDALDNSSQIMLAFSIRHAGEEAAAIDPARPR
jgi:hypothetical protein